MYVKSTTQAAAAHNDSIFKYNFYIAREVEFWGRAVNARCNDIYKTPHNGIWTVYFFWNKMWRWFRIHIFNFFVNLSAAEKVRRADARARLKNILFMEFIFHLDAALNGLYIFWFKIHLVGYNMFYFHEKKYSDNAEITFNRICKIKIISSLRNFI